MSCTRYFRKAPTFSPGRGFKVYELGSYKILRAYIRSFKPTVTVLVALLTGSDGHGRRGVTAGVNRFDTKLYSDE